MNQAIVACAIIHQRVDDIVRILLTKRSPSSNFLPNVYEIPGGHIEHGEDLTTGLMREIKEELDLTIKVGDLFDAFAYSHNGSHTVELAYFATPQSDISSIRIQEDEISEFRWITEDELDTVVSVNKNPDDPELTILKKAFTKLRQ